MANLIEAAKSKVRNFLSSQPGQVVSKFGNDLSRTLQNIGTGLGAGIQAGVSQPLAGLRERNMMRSQNLASQAMQEKIRQQEGLTSQQNIPYLLSQSRAYANTPDFAASNLKFAESNLQNRINTGTQQTGIAPFLRYAAPAANIALTGAGAKTIAAMPALAKIKTLGTAAGISGVVGGLTGQNPIESAVAGVLQTPRIVGLTGITAPITKVGAAGIMDKFATPFQRNIVGRGLTGLGNVIEDEFISRMDGIKPGLADRALSFGIGALLAPTKEYEEYLTSGDKGLVKQARKVIRDLQGRYAKEIGVAKESLEYFFTPSGKKVIKGEPPKMYGMDEPKIKKFIEDNIPGAKQGFGNIAESIRDEAGNVKPEYDPLSSLKQEARKYKSAEEFVNRGQFDATPITNTPENIKWATQLEKDINDLDFSKAIKDAPRDKKGDISVDFVKYIENKISDFNRKYGTELTFDDYQNRNIDLGIRNKLLVDRYSEEVTKFYNQAKELTPEVTTPSKAPVLETPVTKETMKIVAETPPETALPTGKIRIQKQPKSVGQELNQKSQKVSGSKSLDNIISTSGIDVKSKVNLVDYIRTPDRVLNKIGLGKEAVLLRKSYDKYLAELPTEINKITQWSKQVPEESNQRIFQFLDGKQIELNPQEAKVAKEIRSYLNVWADKLGLDKTKRITNYITHIFEKDFLNKEFDPEIAKLIENRVAGSVYDPFTEKRLGALGYKENTWEALDAYVKRAVRKVNMDPALERVKEASKGLESSQFDYVKNYVDRINMRPTKIDNLLDNTIKSFVGYKYGMRPVTYLTGKGRQMVYRGALGLNVGSALRNLSQGANTYAKLGEKYTVRGYLDLFKNGTKELEDVGVLRDDLIQDRTLSATKLAAQKLDKGLFYLFETAEKMNRGSAYYGAKAKALAEGLNESDAVEYAKNLVRDTQFSFGRVDTPVALQSDLAKLVAQFQSYSLKQGEFLGEMLGKKDWAGLARYTAASLAYVYTIGELMGMSPKDIIPSFRFSAPPTLGLPYELGRTLITGKDKYGNELEPMEKVNQVGSSLVPYVPGGVQAKKTITGLRDVTQGGSYTPSGRLKYPIEQTPSNFVRGGLFGSYNLPAAQEFKSLKTSALSAPQTAVVESSTDKTSTYKKIMSDRLKGREEKKIKENVVNSGKSEVLNNKAYYLDGDTVKTIDYGKVMSLPSSNQYETAIKNKKMYAILDDVTNSTLDEGQKNQIYSQLGVSPQTAKYYTVASEDNEIKTAYIMDRLKSIPENDRTQMFKVLIAGRLEVNKKQIVTNTVLNNLNDQGLISDDELKQLKNLKLDSTGKPTIKLSGRGKKAKLKAIKMTPLKIKKGKSSIKGYNINRLKLRKY